MRITWRKVVAIGVIAAGLGTSGAAAANAAFTTDCGSNYLCVYNQSSFQDQLAKKTSGFAQVNLPTADRYKMSSWENHSAKTGGWYDGGVGQPTSVCYNMNSQTVNGNVGILVNDYMVSWQGNGGC